MNSYPAHWSYYTSLEDDLVATGRYVEICEENFQTYSTYFTRLLFAAASEVDVVAKTLCSQIDPPRKYKGINDYRPVITQKFPAIPRLVFGVQWNPVRISPWAAWGTQSPSNPDGWSAYNGVKHERNVHFKRGNLRNALEAMAGLYSLVRHLKEDEGRPRPDRFLRIESST